MNIYRILGHNIRTDRWEDLEPITSTSTRGANQKAFNRYGQDFYEFLVTLAK